MSTIRAATSADFSLVTRLMREFYDHFPDLQYDEARSAEALRKLIETPDLGTVWLILSGSDVVGYLALTFAFSLEFMGRTAWIDEFFIEEAFRGAGLGKTVVELVAAECRAEGINALFLELDQTNERAGRLYRIMGFEPRSIYTTFVLCGE